MLQKYKESDLENRKLFGGRVVRNEPILLYSELPEREDSSIIDAAKNSLDTQYLDFILLFKKEPNEFTDKTSFINSLDAFYCIDIDDMLLKKYISEKSDFRMIMNRKLTKVHVFTKGEILPEIIVKDDKEIPVYVLVVPGIPIRDC